MVQSENWRANNTRVVPICFAFFLLASCSQNSNDKTPNNIAILQSQVVSLTGRVDRLESELENFNRSQTELKSTAPPKPVQTNAMLVGSTVKGQPIQIEFQSKNACEKARKSLLDEGLRACAGHDVQDSTAGMIYGQCPKPQAACIER